MIYVHYKGGEYEVVGLAHVEATLEAVVVYRSVETGDLWTRPVREFFGDVPNPDAIPGDPPTVARFAPKV